MTIPVLQITDAGLAAIQALAGTETVTITQMGLTNTPFIAAPTLTDLPGEFKRLDAVGGEAAAPNLTHLSAYDTSADAWTATGLGLYLDDGTLFAAYSGEASLISKAELSFGLIDCDIAFATDLSASIDFGMPVFTVPPATTEIRGIIEIATEEEASEGTDTLRAIVPATLKAVLDALSTAFNAAIDALTGRTITGGGLVTGGGDLSEDRILTVTAATAAVIAAGTDTESVVTPLGLASLPKSFGTNGYATMPGGQIIQQGRVTASANAVTSVTFPLAFPSACYSVVASGAGTDDNLDAKDNWPAVHAGSITATGFTMFSATDNDVPTSWIAIGS